MPTFKDFLAEKISAEYHDTLNPRLWTDKQDLKGAVKTALNKIADEFIEFLGVNRADVKDVIITGSNVAFNYTQQSDIDLHLIVDTEAASICNSCSGDFIEDCFFAKKQLWNQTHDITIYGYDVELYAQPLKGSLIAAGVYSIWDNKWITKPEYKKPKIKSASIQSKVKQIEQEIDSLLDSRSDDRAAIDDLLDKIWKARKAGLEFSGEFSTEAIVFKELRNSGYIQKLKNYRRVIYDRQLSLK